MTLDEIITNLKSGKTVNMGCYFTIEEMKREMALIREQVPAAWVRRSSSTNNWIVSPK